MKVYRVGGAVRDQILGCEPNDIDYVVVGATIEEMKNLGFQQVGKDFPVFLHPQTKEEYALARKEVKIGEKHTDFEFIFDQTVTLREDLERRDFTCNAVAYDEGSKRYIDHFGGIQDIKNKVLRHINDVHFMEDPLRILRLCRFAAQLNFNAAPETIKLCKEMVNQGMMKHLSCERVWAEIFKALKSPSFFRFVELGLDCGALKAVLPEVEKMWHIPEGEAGLFYKDLGGHVLGALKFAQYNSAIVKFGILMIHIPKTISLIPHHLTPQAHEQGATDMILSLCRRLRVPHDFRSFAVLATQRYLNFHFIPQMSAESLYGLAEAMIIRHKCYVEEFIEVCRAEAHSIDQASNAHQNLQFEESAQKLRDACKILAGVKATDMPGFEQLIKNKSFKTLLREFKIKKLHEKLFTVITKK